MSKSIKNEKQLNQALWQSADELRGRMDAEDYRNYLLSLMGYDVLSTEQENYIKKIPKDFQSSKLIKAQSIQDLGFYVPKKYLFNTLVDEINGKLNQAFSLVTLRNAFSYIEKSSLDNNSTFNLNGIFADCDLASNKLGKSKQTRTGVIEVVMQNLSQIDFNNYSGDAIGDAYEYLIGQFAKNTGKKAGEFYTPLGASELLTRLALLYHNNRLNSVDDPCVGSGSLLLKTRHYNKANINDVMYNGREYNTATYNLARFNLVFNHIPFGHINLENGDTLAPQNSVDYLKSNPMESHGVDAVLMNPPFSQQWGSKKDSTDDWHKASNDSDSRFDYGIAPKNKADYAFLLHGLYQLNKSGVETIIVPLGVLFRGGTEKQIRTNLLKHHQIREVIQLPDKLFFSTSIPTAMIVLQKTPSDDNVLFINASKEYKKVGKKNVLTEKNINKIVKISKDKKEIKRFSHIANYKTIKQNQYNLNISRYVDTYVPKPLVNMNKNKVQIRNMREKLLTVQKKLKKLESKLIK